MVDGGVKLSHSAIFAEWDKIAQNSIFIAFHGRSSLIKQLKKHTFRQKSVPHFVFRNQYNILLQDKTKKNVLSNEYTS